MNILSPDLEFVVFALNFQYMEAANADALQEGPRGVAPAGEAEVAALANKLSVRSEQPGVKRQLRLRASCVGCCRPDSWSHQ